jgi:hypothetical protein
MTDDGARANIRLQEAQRSDGSGHGRTGGATMEGTAPPGFSSRPDRVEPGRRDRSERTVPAASL